MAMQEVRVNASLDDAAWVEDIPWFGEVYVHEDLDKNDHDFRSFLRFVLTSDIVAGSIITVAYIKFTCSHANVVGNSAISIKGLDVDDVGNFPNVGVATGYPLTTAVTNWAPGDWTLDAEYNCDSIIGPAQEILTLMGNIAVGEHIGFKFYATARGATRYAYSWDGDDTKAPLLHLEWSPSYQPRPPGIAVNTGLIF